MYGLAVIEVMTMSGHLSNIDEISVENEAPGGNNKHSLLKQWRKI